MAGIGNLTAVRWFREEFTRHRVQWGWFGVMLFLVGAAGIVLTMFKLGQIPVAYRRGLAKVGAGLLSFVLDRRVSLSLLLVGAALVVALQVSTTRSVRHERAAEKPGMRPPERPRPIEEEKPPPPKAVTAMKHGRADGTILSIEPGESVPREEFTDQQWRELRRAGSIEIPTEGQQLAGPHREAELTELEVGRQCRALAERIAEYVNKVGLSSGLAGGAYVTEYTRAPMKYLSDYAQQVIWLRSEIVRLGYDPKNIDVLLDDGVNTPAQIAAIGFAFGSWAEILTKGRP